MNTEWLDGLSKSIGVLLVLSLAVERVAVVFKRRDWQPLSLRWWPKRLRFGRFKKSSSVFHVDLRTERVYDPYAHAGGEVAVAASERQAILRNVNGENTALIGVVLAVITRTDALSGLGFGDAGKLEPVAQWLRIAVTGLAAGIGSSFWYDLLRLVNAARQARTAAVPQPEQGMLGAAQAADADENRYRIIFRAAQEQAKRLTSGDRTVRVVPMVKRTEADAGIGLFVAKGDLPADLAGDRLTLQVPGEPSPVPIPILHRRTKRPGAGDGD